MSGQQIFGDDRSNLVTVYYASASFFSVLGVSPALGRLFTFADDTEMSDAVVISHEAWQRRFGGRSDVIGLRVALSYTHSTPSATKTIVGVLPSGFEFQGEAPELLLPMGLMAFNGSFEANRFLRVVARLAPGISLDQAQAIVEPLVRRFESPDQRAARVVSLAEDRFGTNTRSLWFSFGAAGLLSAVACAALAGLLLVDGWSRRHEIGIRVALGATRTQLVRSLALESLLLIAVASGAGVLLARWFAAILLTWAPAAVQAVNSVSVDYQVGIAAWIVASMLSLLVAVGPALIVTTPAQTTLPRAGLGGSGHRLIVAAQLALALILVSCASYFELTVQQFQSKPLGFEPDHVAVASVRLLREPTPAIVVAADVVPTERRAALEQRLNAGWVHTQTVIDRLSALPAVVAAAGASAVPFARPAPAAQVRESDATDEHQLQWQAVTEEYFRVLGIPVVRGRTFQPADRDPGIPYWVVVSAAEEKRLSTGVALGKTLVWARYPFKVVGVVAEVQQHKDSGNREKLPALYVTNFRAQDINYFLVRTSGDPRTLLPEIRRTIEDLDGSLKVTSMRTLSELVAESSRGERFLAYVSMTFGALAMTIAAVGLFGLITYLVSLKQQEIAIRMALGASRSAVRGLLLRDGAIVVALGLLGGLPASYVTLQLIRSRILDAPATPVLPWLMGLAVVVLAAIVAAAMPLRRSDYVDPATLLRT